MGSGGPKTSEAKHEGFDWRPSWLGVLLVAATLLGLALVLVSGATDGPRPPFLVASKRPPPEAPSPRPRDGLRLAGSGSNIPVTRALAEEYVAIGRPRPIIHASIGSTGGLSALLDGVIDIALVSRPLTDHERAQGFFEIPYARVPVMVAVHSAVEVENISIEELIQIFRGDVRTWPDGTPIVVLQREPGDSSHDVIDRVLPQFATVNDQAYRQRRWQVLYHDVSMQETLSNLEGSIGLYGSGLGPGVSGFKVLRVEGVAPDPDAVAAQTYPFVKTISFVTLGPPAEETLAFIAFATHTAARPTLLEYQMIPAPTSRGSSSNAR